MGKTCTLLLIVISSAITTSFSQSFHVAVNAGVANYCGDIQQKFFTFQKARPVIGVGVQYTLFNKLSLRSEYSVSSLIADDKNNKRVDLRERNLNFQTSLSEINLMVEYNLLSLEHFKFTPYVFVGASMFHFNPYTYTAGKEKIHLRDLSTEGQGLPEYPDRKEYKTTQFSIPYGAGLKYALSDYIQIGAELGLRKLFTDYLDDVSTTYVDGNLLLENRGPVAYEYSYRADELGSHTEGYPGYRYIRGDPKQNDSYYFAQLRLLVSMGWFSLGKDSYDRSFSKRRGRTGCPLSVL